MVLWCLAAVNDVSKHTSCMTVNRFQKTVDLFVSFISISRGMIEVTQDVSCKQHDPHPQIQFDFVEKHTFKVVFVEHHTHFNVYVSQRSEIQFEDYDHAIYMSFIE